MNNSAQKKHFIDLNAHENRDWSTGWSAQLSEGLVGVVWDVVVDDKLAGPAKITTACAPAARLIERTSAVYRASTYSLSGEELVRLGQQTSLIWDDYYMHTARLLWAIPQADMIAMTWGKAGKEILEARKARSNSSRPDKATKIIWDNLRVARKDRRFLQDALFDDADALQQIAEPLYQAYFYHSKPILDALEEYDGYQDSLWHLRSLSLFNLSSEAGAAGEAALRTVSRLIENFHEALRPATLRVLKQCEPHVPPGYWTKPPKLIPDFGRR